MRPARAAVTIALLAGLTYTPTAGAADPAPRVPPPAYYRPVVSGGFAFPVARSNWLSVIGFENDWHEPRFRLVDGRWQLVGVHEGTDILAEKGTPVVSTSAGTVEAVGWTFYSGTRVGIRGTDGRYYFYAHLSQVAPEIRAGDPVEPGSLIGRVGNTGYGPPGHEDEFPPHLHFGIEGPAGWENPFPLLRRLYRRSVAVAGRGEERLTEVSGDGRPGSWHRLVGRLYAGWSPPGGMPSTGSGL